mmetsp:Transcript_35132/g.47976  ORF Transcript_35132/g.47976 Transcript_35132/m.47976 type:complete len:229 (-) Transcript_35132:218-904(-)
MFSSSVKRFAIEVAFSTARRRTESWSSFARSTNLGITNFFRDSISEKGINFFNWILKSLRTIGVESLHNWSISVKTLSEDSGGTVLIITGSNMEAATRIVNHSPEARRWETGIICETTFSGFKDSQIHDKEAIACSRTVASSTEASCSKGETRRTTNSGPPIKGGKQPSCSARTPRTSSSSSVAEAVRNGISSVRVLSGPRASAILVKLLTEFKRSSTSSFLSSSMRI